jgi:enoyl-CoA hydratase/carnithine racemase
MDILTQVRDGVMAIEFNRPQKKNALTGEMYGLLNDALNMAEADDAVRAVLFHGKPDLFTAGNDLEDFVKRPPLGDDTPVFRFMRAVSQAKKPLVGAVTGPAVGIGTTLLLHCEIVIAGDNARFSLPFTQLGLVPEFASSYVLPWIAGYQRAAELLLLGEPFGPEKAREAGFVTRIVPAAEAIETGWEAARKLARLPAKSLRVTKALMKAGHAAAIEAQIATEGAHFQQMLTEPAAREAFSAFLEKRKPDFSRDNG